MNKAEAMIVAYARAGFTKLHLDTSMGCAGEPFALDDATTAARAARLAAAAETQAMPVPPCTSLAPKFPFRVGLITHWT